MVYGIHEAARDLTRLACLSPTEPVRGDISTVIIYDQDGKSQMASDVRVSNRNGYIPIVSIATGLLRVILRIIDIVNTINLIRSGKTSWESAKGEIGEDVLFALRGLGEMVPLLGNGLMYAVDRIRIKGIEDAILKETQEKKSFQGWYINGKWVSMGVYDHVHNLESQRSSMGFAGLKFV